MKSEPSLRSAPPRSSAQERETPLQSSAKPDAAASSRIQHSSSNSAINGTPPSIQISHSESQVLSTRTASGKEPPFSRQLSTGSLRRKPSMDVESSNYGGSRASASASASSAPLRRSGSLRSKISLSALRARSLRDDDGLHEGDTVQVKDTDFELVRPNPARPRVSEDSSANSKSEGSEGRPPFLRIDSPAASTTSGGASDTRSPISPSAMSLPPTTAAQMGTSAGAVEAHRARELKWLSVMSSTPSSHARKSKKIRKLLQDGVPASVRYQVWAHLTDSRAKRIEGLYVQLGHREKVPAFAEIQRDAHLCFPTDTKLSQPNGPLVSLLQAYLTMVPDIQYYKGGLHIVFVLIDVEGLTPVRRPSQAWRSLLAIFSFSLRRRTPFGSSYLLWTRIFGRTSLPMQFNLTSTRRCLPRLWKRSTPRSRRSYSPIWLLPPFAFADRGECFQA